MVALFPLRRLVHADSSGTAALDCRCFREYAQRLRHYLPQIDDAGVEVVGVSLGTVDAARYFCAETGFPLNNMFMVSTILKYARAGGDVECVHWLVGLGSSLLEDGMKAWSGSVMVP